MDSLETQVTLSLIIRTRTKVSITRRRTLYKLQVKTQLVNRVASNRVKVTNHRTLRSNSKGTGLIKKVRISHSNNNSISNRTGTGYRGARGPPVACVGTGGIGQRIVPKIGRAHV